MLWTLGQLVVCLSVLVVGALSVEKDLKTIQSIGRVEAIGAFAGLGIVVSDYRDSTSRLRLVEEILDL